MIKLEKKGKILSADSRPYDFNGRSGTSHKVRALLEDGEIYVLNATPEQVKELQSEIGKEGMISFGISSPKERLSIKLLSEV